MASEREGDLRKRTPSDLFARSVSFDSAIARVSQSQDILQSAGSHSLSGLSDPTSESFLQAQVFAGRIRKTIVEKTIPALRAMKAENDAILKEQIASTLAVSSQKISPDELSKIREELQRLQEEGYLESNIPLLAVDAAIEIANKQPTNPLSAEQTGTITMTEKKTGSVIEAIFPNRGSIGFREGTTIKLLRTLVAGPKNLEQLFAELSESHKGELTSGNLQAYIAYVRNKLETVGYSIERDENGTYSITDLRASINSQPAEIPGENAEATNKIETVTLPLGEVIVIDSQVEGIILSAIAAQKYTKGQIAEMAFGENTPQTRDWIDNWISKIRAERLEVLEYSIAEVPTDDQDISILAIVSNENPNGSFSLLTRRTTTPGTPETAGAGKLEPLAPLPEERFAAIEYILQNSDFTGKGVADRLGKDRIGRSRSWSNAFVTIGASLQRMDNRRKAGVASEREITILEDIERRTGQTGRAARVAFVHPMKEHMRQTSKIQSGEADTDLISMAPAQDIEQDIEQGEEIEQTVFLVGQSLLLLDKKVVVANGRNYTFNLPQGIKEICEALEKLHGEQLLGKSLMMKDLNDLYESLSDADTALDFIESQDELETQNLLYWLESEKTYIFELVRLQGEADENAGVFEISTKEDMTKNDTFIPIENQATMPAPSSVESGGSKERKPEPFVIEANTRTIDVRELVATKTRQVRNRGATGRITFSRIIGEFRLSRSDIETAVAQGYLKKQTGGIGAFEFTPNEVVMLLVRKDLKKVNLNNRQKKDLIDVVNEMAEELLGSDNK